uniref:hypothetical protein n=1 Tax=Alistipes sp. TaxID=1872444 RepID=UPI004055F910
MKKVFLTLFAVVAAWALQAQELNEKTNSKPVAYYPAEAQQTNVGVKFQGQVNLGAIFNADAGGPAFDLNLGAHFGNHLFAGVETGFHSMISTIYLTDGYDIYETDAKLFEGYIPLGLNLKLYFTKNKPFNPYLTATVGGFFGVADLGGWNGLNFRVGLGLDYKRFNIAIGYNGIHKYGTASTGFVQLGYRFGGK